MAESYDTASVVNDILTSEDELATQARTLALWKYQLEYDVFPSEEQLRTYLMQGHGIFYGTWRGALRERGKNG